MRRATLSGKAGAVQNYAHGVGQGLIHPPQGAWPQTRLVHLQLHAVGPGFIFVKRVSVVTPTSVVNVTHELETVSANHDMGS